jgi:hypothetical protein
MGAGTATLPPALKHGAYSTATLLPGEDGAAFDHLHQSLIAELAPEGALEEHIVANMARFVWRREHLDILRVAELAESRISALFNHQLLIDILPDPSDADAARAAAKAQAREELGEVCDLVDMEITETRLASEIELRARLDEMVDKCLKRLLFLRGLKSMAGRRQPHASRTSPPMRCR